MIQIRDGIYWVGAVDWNVRNFHGYITHRGTTYNAYLIVDDKIALVDSVKEPFYPEMMMRIREVLDPREIDLIVSNHTEPDHSGAIVNSLKASPDAELIASDRGKAGLQKYYGKDLRVTTISEKPKISLGKRTLQFVATPMLHWPDSMVTYIPEDRLLLSNDAFGQHLASSKRFDDEVDHAVLMQEAAKYYANIVMPLWKVVLRALDALGGLEIETIAPSHGIVWRKNPGEIVEAYRRWADGVTVEKAVIVYDSMWGSTEMIARAIEEGIVRGGVHVQVHKLSATHNSDVIADILDAKAVLVGSPTLNTTLFPTVASFLAYLKGLKPRNKIGAAFGSFGWGGGSKKAAEEELKEAGIDLIQCDLDFAYRPTVEELRKATEFGEEMAKKIKGA